jgi:transposase-like protein
MEQASFGRDCEIEAVGKQRNGKPRYWCRTHQSSATAKYGRRLLRCEGAYKAATEHEAIDLDPSAFPGGLALWGAVRPVYDTTSLPTEEGVHVHARWVVDGDKEIDGTFAAVAVRVRRNLLEAPKAVITLETAVAAYVSRFLNRPMKSLFCTYCGDPHLDSDWFAVKQHKRHLCHNCGQVFVANEKCVSNPVANLRHMFGDTTQRRSFVPATERLEIRQSDFPGGIQVWASNPALLWTAPTPEKEGIHVHVYSADGEIRVHDETYSEVIIDGVSLDQVQLSYLMAQRALRYLDGKIVSLKCGCGLPYFDEGEAAFRPHNDRTCGGCGRAVLSKGRLKNVVSNPFLDTIAQLEAKAAA